MTYRATRLATRRGFSPGERGDDVSRIAFSPGESGQSIRFRLILR